MEMVQNFEIRKAFSDAENWLLQLHQFMHRSEEDIIPNATITSASDALQNLSHVLTSGNNIEVNGQKNKVLMLINNLQNDPSFTTLVGASQARIFLDLFNKLTPVLESKDLKKVQGAEFDALGKK